MRSSILRQIKTKSLTILYIVISIQFLYGCVSYHSSPYSARIVSEEESSTGFLFQYSNEHDEHVLNKRINNNFGSDFDEGLPQSGFGISKRLGLSERFDWGLLLYSGLAAIDLRYQIYQDQKYAMALSGMLGLTPFFPEDEGDLSSYLSLQQSYDLLSAMTLIYHFHAIYFPFPEGKKYLGTSLGFILGRENGLIFEWNYYQSVYKKKKHESLDQFVIGYTTKIGRLKGKKALKDSGADKTERINFSYEIGSTLAPNLSMGVKIGGKELIKFPIDLSINFGIGPLPPSIDKNYEGLVSSGFLSISAVLDQEYGFFRAGVARRDVRINIDLEEGWRRIVVLTHGPEIAIGHNFESFSIEWFGLFIPIKIFPRSKRFLTGSGSHFEPEDSISALADRYYNLPSISLLKFQRQI